MKWFGEYPDEDLPRRMAEADFLVLPSVTVEERFGIVLLEAMAADARSLRRLCRTGVREVNVPGETGLEVPLQDVAALAEALETLAHDPFKRNRWASGRRRVEKYFTRALMASGTSNCTSGCSPTRRGSSGSRLARQKRISGTSMLKKLPLETRSMS